MRVSVIIPCFNVESYIEECIDSVLNQNYNDIEIICIDNNSSDETLSKLQELKYAHPQLIVDSELKPGANAARNKGLSHANGEWIQFLDADDLILPDKIEHQLLLIHSCKIVPAFIAAAYTAQTIDGNTTIIHPDTENPHLGVFTNRAGITSGNLWSRKALAAVSDWNDELLSSQEADLMMRLVLNGGKILSDRTPKTIVRERESGQISKKNPSARWKQYIDVRLSYMGKLEQKDSAVYSQNLGAFQDFLMISILSLYRSDKNSAQEIFRKHIKPNWHSEGKYGMTSYKKFLIRIFGLGILAK